MSLLQDLPLQLQESITGLFAACSLQAMEDLRNLRATCKQMHRACTSVHIGPCLPLQRVLWRAFDSNDNDIDDFSPFRDTLLANLTRDAVGNPDACYLVGLNEVFVDDRVPHRPSLHMLERATEAGHQMEAYMLGLCLYRLNSDAGDDYNAFWLISKVEGDEDPGVAVVAASAEGRPKAWKTRECVRSRYVIRREYLTLLLASKLIIWEGLGGYPIPFARPVVHGNEHHHPQVSC